MLLLPRRQLTTIMFPRALLVLVFLSLVGAMEIFPTNDTLPQSPNQLLLRYGGSATIIEPLTESAGSGANSVALGTVKRTGNIKSLTAETLKQLTKDDIALVNCDATPSTQDLSPSALVQSFSEQSPAAIVLYSFTSARCGISDEGGFTGYFTIPNFTPMMLTTLTSINQKGTIGAQNTASSVPTQPATTGNVNNQQTPAVAMSILYAVTGIITVLFLVIIALGAWRAHNNPERYGPRTGFAGRPRQSRAKGLARAMLETLPIVKFGDPVAVKGENGDVELQDTAAEGRHMHTDPEAERQSKPELRSAATPGATNNGGSKDIPEEGARRRESQLEAHGTNVGCSICTEDFKKGEDVRVLPCNHQYHPNCIDPWLLNVSGTCPLCRIDLRPVPEVDPAPTEAAETASAPATAAGTSHSHHSRVQRILAMRHASVHERIATLRQLATEAGREHGIERHRQSPAEEERHRRRDAERLRSALRIRTRRASTSGPSHAGAEATSAQTETTVTTEGTGESARTQ